MTLYEFFDQVREVAKTDKPFVYGGYIRFPFKDTVSCRRRTCPVSAVANNLFGTSFGSGDFTNAGVRLSLHADDMYEIADAADDPAHPMRLQLLEACGLKERD